MKWERGIGFLFGIGAVYTGVWLAMMPDNARADWAPGDECKYVQMPDTTYAGIDIQMNVGPEGVQRIVADDFLCVTQGLITDVHLWCSWWMDEPGTITNLHLAIYSDFPDPDKDGPLYSHPSNLLWMTVLTNGQFVVNLYTNLDEREYFWDPVQELIAQPNADSNIWQINVPFDPADAFMQTGSVERPVVYWLAVSALTDKGRLGWKTRDPLEGHFNDDAVYTVDGGQMWRELRYPDNHPHHVLPNNSIDLSFVITTTSTGTEETAEAKWVQPLDTEAGIDVASWGQGPMDFWVADDFVSDGRPITGIRWWGSYIGYATNVPGPVSAPFPRPLNFTLRWLRDVPAGVNAEYSMPGAQIEKVTYGLAPYVLGGITETYCTSIWHEAEGVYEHEFVYDLTFTNSPWNEKEGVVYWLGIQANYMEAPTSNWWGWATTSLEHHWNDDAVRTNGMLAVGFEELRYANLWPDHPYGTNSVDLAFVLYTDVIARRAKKWLQPPDMITGENMDCWFYPGMPGQAKRRGDDFISDGRRITDVHWWGSYLSYLTNYPGPVSIPSSVRPSSFHLSWWSDQPTNGSQLYSKPLAVITNINVPIDLCHEVYYGTVTQAWKIPLEFEHEFQYYVDLLNPEIVNGGPWLELKGTTYWLVIQAQFTNWNLETHRGWGWKTTPKENKWNDDSVRDSGGAGNWTPASYPVDNPNYPIVTNCDLAFELTTDEVGTNQWYQPIVIRRISQSGGTSFTMGSVGDSGSGVQVMQSCTNLVTVSSNWLDVATNRLPLPSPYTNWWNHTAPTGVSEEFFRVKQR